MVFTPTYDQPISLAELNKLEPQILTLEVTRLSNSIAHLQRSNTELTAFVSSPEFDDQDSIEFPHSIRENEMTILTQQERLHMVRLALQDQLGIDAANSHYSIAADAIPRPVVAAGEAPSVAVTRENVSNGPTAGMDLGTEDEGMYL